MADSKAFKLKCGITAEMVGQEVSSFLQNRKQMTVEESPSDDGYFIQAKLSGSGSTWKKVAGMDLATQVQIITNGDTITVNIGAGQWIDKIGVGAVGMIFFAPLAVTSVIGAIGQKKLPSEIFDVIGRFVGNSGSNVNAASSSSSAAKTSDVICSKCNTANSNGTKFCKNCGDKLSNSCPNCSADIPAGVKFCPSCGHSIEKKNSCSNCNAQIADGTKFCPECGQSTAKTEKVCLGCGMTLAEGTKFCSGCGASVE